MRLKGFVANIVLLLGVCFLFIAVAEVFLRVTHVVSLRPRPPLLYAVHSDPGVGYALKPNIHEKAYHATVTTNSLGLRGPEIDQAKPVIAVLGDSIVFGYGVEDHQTLPARLQQKIPGWNVVNGAIPGYALGQEAALYRDRIATLNPKVLVLVFYFNDLDDQRPPMLDPQGILRSPGWEGVEKPDCDSSQPLRWIPGSCWLDTHSAIFVAAKKFLNARRERYNLAEQKEEYRTNIFGDDVAQEKLDAYEAVLDRFAKTLPPGIPKLFVIWPEKRIHYSSRPRLIAMAEQWGFKTLDLYQIFGNDPESLSWDTVHPSPKTIDEAAEVIAAALGHYGLLAKGAGSVFNP